MQTFSQLYREVQKGSHSKLSINLTKNLPMSRKILLDFFSEPEALEYYKLVLNTRCMTCYVTSSNGSAE